MAKAECSHRKVNLAYPKHWPRPEDLLNFIESKVFTKQWEELGLDVEDELLSLQLCVMAYPNGDGAVAGSDKLRFHRHKIGKRFIRAYYAYFPDFGIVYLVCIEDGDTPVCFSTSELELINRSMTELELELEQRKKVPLTRSRHRE